MSELTIARTPLIIAAEINAIKDQAKRILLTSSIEIGRRLTEAKSLVPHGEWTSWLQQSVDYSQSTANNLMRIFEQYGSDQLGLFDNNAKSQALGNLSYTQAVALLGIPADEREEFIQEHDIDGMSTRELQQAVKEKQEIEEKLKQTESNLRVAESGWETAKQEVEKLQENTKKQKELAGRLKQELEAAKAAGKAEDVASLQAELDKANQELSQSLEKVKDLERQLKEPAEVAIVKEIVEKVPDAVQRELEALRAKVNRTPDEKQFELQFNLLVKCFDGLLGALAGVVNEDTRETYRVAVGKLTAQMQGRLNA